MAIEIQIRRDTAANWNSANPILAQGEPALETDTKKQKIGDGVTAWLSLPYSFTGGTVTSVTAADSTISVGGTSSAPTLARPALTGDVTAASGSNATALAGTSNVNTVVSGLASVAGKLPLAGGALTGEVTTTFAPVNANDLATKSYVDAGSAGLTINNPVNCATTAALPTGTYNNGTAGVGATFTVTATGTLTIDGHLTVLNDRILVQNQASGFQNGYYLVTTAGASGVSAVLTRTTDMNTGGAAPNEFDGAYCFVLAGTANMGAGFICTNAGTVTIGTTAITFVQFSQANVTAGSGLTQSGTLISMPAVGTAGTYGSATTVPVLTTDAFGRVTAVTNTPITGGGGGSGVTELVAGTNVSLSPSGGTGVVTINASGASNSNYANMFNVLAYGAKGDGVTDDTAAIQAAIVGAAGDPLGNSFQATGAGGVVWFPPCLTGKSYLFSTLQVPNNVALWGGGWIMPSDNALGGLYNGVASGSVLQSTTSGVAIQYVSPPNSPTMPIAGGRRAGTFNVRDLCIIGQGNSGSTGLQLSQDPSFLVQGTALNVMVCNFGTCWSMFGIENSVFMGVHARGCNTGFYLGNSDFQSAANCFNMVEVSFANTYAIEVDHCASNSFTALVLQGCHSATAYIYNNHSYQCIFDNIYCETSSPGVTYHVLHASGDYNEYRNFNISDASGVCNIDFQAGVNNTVSGIYNGSAAVVVASGLWERVENTNSGFSAVSGPGASGVLQIDMTHGIFSPAGFHTSSNNYD